MELKGKAFFQAIVRHISAYKQSGHNLREAELRYRTLFNQSPDGILIIDVNGNFIEFNEAAYSQLGYSREEFAKLRISDIDPVESPDEIQNRINETLEKGKAEFEVRHRTKDGEIRDVYVITKVMASSGQTVFHTIWRDITERKKAEYALRKSESRLAEAELIAKFGSWEVLQQKDEVTWSKGALNIFGVTPEEFKGTYQAYLDFVHPDDGGRVMKLVAEALEGHRPLSYETRIIRKDGSVRTIYVYGEVKRGEDGRPVRMIGTVQDITERKALEKQREGLLEVLRHDMKTPLAIITGNTEEALAQGRGRLGEKVAEALESIYLNAKNLGKMLDDQVILFNLESNLLKDVKENVDIDELLLEASVNISGLARGKGLTVERRVDGVLPHVFVDRSHLFRAVINLLQNAVNYTPAGGTIIVSACSSNRGGKDCVLISVSDDGVGIPVDEQGKVFEKYYRAANARDVKGSGLGLAIVKGVVEQYGGQIELESEPGRGSTFRLFLPAAPDAG